MTPAKRERTRGFTLLEILVAVAILAVALVTVLGLHARNVRLTSQSQDITIAGLLASRLAAFSRMEPAEFGSISGTFNADDSIIADVVMEYGGPLAERFVWKREVLPLGPAAFGRLRRVRIAVGTSLEQPLAELELWVRQPNT